MISLPDSSNGVLYAGNYSDIAMWKIVEGITVQKEKYFYISDTPAGALMGKQSEPFYDVLDEIIGEDYILEIFKGSKKKCYLSEDMYVLNFNDFVSQNLAEKYVGNNGDAIVIASNYNSDSVLIRTEIPVLLDKQSVKTINGISKEALIEYRNSIFDGKNDVAANQKLVSVISSIAEEHLKKIKLSVLTDEEVEKLLIDYPKDNVLEIITHIYEDENIMVDTSDWLDNTDKSVFVLGNDINMTEKLNAYVTKNNENKKLKNTEGLNDFISFHENKIFDTGDGSSKIYDVSKAPTGFTRKKWYDLISIADDRVMSESDLKGKYKYLVDLSQEDIDAFRAYEYFTAKGIDAKSIKSNGILTDAELRGKYSILSDVTDIEVMDAFRTYEYKTINNKINRTRKTVYFNKDGKVMGVDFSNVADSVIKPDGVAFETTLDDIKKFSSDSEMNSYYKDYKNLNKLEQLEAKQLDLDIRAITAECDNIEISPTIVNRYLAASGKKIYVLMFCLMYFKVNEVYYRKY